MLARTLTKTSAKKHSGALGSKAKKAPTATTKRYSVTLALSLASRIAALREMHPQKKRHEILSDLLELGLAQIDSAASGSNAGFTPYYPDTRQAVYLLSGPFSEFHGLVHKHHLALEHELDQESTEPLCINDDYSLSDAQ